MQNHAVRENQNSLKEKKSKKSCAFDICCCQCIRMIQHFDRLAVTNINGQQNICGIDWCDYHVSC